MDTAMAFAMGDLNRGKDSMVFDWDKAARLIKEASPDRAYAGLRGDWEYTGGIIYADGLPAEHEMGAIYLASTWAVPELEMDGEVQACFVMKGETEWDSGTYWPESARAILTNT